MVSALVNVARATVAALWIPFISLLGLEQPSSHNSPHVLESKSHTLPGAVQSVAGCVVDEKGREGFEL